MRHPLHTAHVVWRVWTAISGQTSGRRSKLRGHGFQAPHLQGGAAAGLSRIVHGAAASLVASLPVRARLEPPPTYHHHVPHVR